MLYFSCCILILKCYNLIKRCRRIWSAGVESECILVKHLSKRLLDATKVGLGKGAALLLPISDFVFRFFENSTVFEKTRPFLLTQNRDLDLGT